MVSAPADFGRLPDGRQATLFSLDGDSLAAKVTDYGGRLVSLKVMDAAGGMREVSLGFDRVEGYLASGSFGAILGRVANRISGAAFHLAGKRYALDRNDGANTLHGGAAGFGKLLWRASGGTGQELVLELVSPDGDQGFPGDLNVRATYRIDCRTLSLVLEAQTTEPTPVNLSAHPYFNLSDPQSIDALDHEVMICADSFLPTDDRQIPTGEIRAAAGPFDFRRARAPTHSIRTPDPQLVIGRGYDHCFILPRNAGREPQLAARVHAPDKKLALEVWTTQPTVQFYTGNSFTGALRSRTGLLRQSAGLALEPGAYPNAPNQPTFPSIDLSPNALYREVIEYRFVDP